MTISNQSADRALRDVHDEADKSLRVKLTNAEVNINVDAFTDSIAIADTSGNKVTTTLVGAKRSLDVNVTDITLDSANDSVTVPGVSTSAKQDAQTALLTDIKANQTNNTQYIVQKSTSISGNLTAQTTSQTSTPAAGSIVQLSVPDGHSSWSVYLSGTFSATSQVSFEGSQLGTDPSWFNLSMRRNTAASTNDTTTLLDTQPFGGAPPTGGNPSHWRGNAGGVKYLRVRCQVYTALDNIEVYIVSSAGVGTTFLNAAIPTGTNLIGQIGIKALTGFQVSQVAASTTAVKVVSAGMTNRKSISIKARTSSSNQSWYIGHTSGTATSTTGFILGNGEVIEIDLEPTQDIWAICTSVSSDNRLYILEAAGAT